MDVAISNTSRFGSFDQKNASVLVLVIAKPDLITISGAHGFTPLQVRAPWQDRIIEIHFINEGAPRRERRRPFGPRSAATGNNGPGSTCARITSSSLGKAEN